jgi:hypothetical protein
VIAANAFQEGVKVLEVAPIHCVGYRKRQLENDVQQKVMPYLNARYGITFPDDEILLELMECSMAGCPWSDLLAQVEVADG